MRLRARAVETKHLGENGRLLDPEQVVELLAREERERVVVVREQALVTRAADEDPEEHLSRRRAMIPFTRDVGAREDRSVFASRNEKPDGIERIAHVVLAIGEKNGRGRHVL